MLFRSRDLAANYESDEDKVNAVSRVVENVGSNRVTNKEINEYMRIEKEAKEISESLRKISAYLDRGVTVINIERFADLLDKHKSLSQAVRNYQNK